MLAVGDGPRVTGTLRRMRVPSALAALAATVFIAACGGDEDNGTTASTPQPPPPTAGEPRLSKPEFIKQADAICTGYREKTPDTSSVNEFPELKRTVDQIVRLSEATLAKFEGLRPPTADAAVVASYVDTQRRQIALLRDVSAAAVEEDQDQVDRLVGDLRTVAGESKTIAQKYGFKVCASNVNSGPGG